MDHLRHAKEERTLMNEVIAKAKVTATTAGFQRLQPSFQNSKAIAFHYSFDYAQQVHFPSDPMQPSPIYFKKPRKCLVFGVCCEGLPQQVNFLIDEGVSCRKGANSVISYLPFFNADNCSGQK